MTRAKRKKATKTSPAPRPTGAELIVLLRRDLHAAALLEHARLRLQSDFTLDLGDAKCVIEVEGRTEEVHEDTLLDVQGQLALLQREAQARADDTLMRVVGKEQGFEDAPAVRARVTTRRRERARREPGEMEL